MIGKGDVMGLELFLRDFNVSAVTLSIYGLACVIIGVLIMYAAEWVRCLFYLPEDAYPNTGDRLDISKRMLDDYEIILRRYDHSGWKNLSNRIDLLHGQAESLQIDIAVQIERAEHNYQTRWRQDDSNASRVDW